MKTLEGEMRSPINIRRTSYRDGSKFYLSGLITLSVVPDEGQDQEPAAHRLWGVVHLECRDDVVVFIPDFAGISDIARSNRSIVPPDVLNSLRDVIEIRVKLGWHLQNHLEQINTSDSQFVLGCRLQFSEEPTMKAKIEGIVAGLWLESEQPAAP